VHHTVTYRILVIDDDQRLAAMLVDYLRNRGLDPVTAPDGARGLLALRDGTVAAVVLDVMLPDMDGFEVLRRIRVLGNVPVLMLTARGEETDRIVGLELGADDYLPKPFNPRELVARLQAVLRRSRGAQPTDATQRFGTLEVDRAAHEARMGGVRCDLTAYQFTLLALLSENAGRVMSRATLLDRLKGLDDDAFDRSIDVHVSRIRAAIGDDARHPVRIRTIRGTGYLFARLSDD
jgi:DNA-binding response OmpR family regulator